MPNHGEGIWAVGLAAGTIMTAGQDGSGLVSSEEELTQAKFLEDDLRARNADFPDFAERLCAEYDRAREADGIAASYAAWQEGRISQAAAWVLRTLFIRFCEDNGLIEWPFLAGTKSGWRSEGPARSVPPRAPAAQRPGVADRRVRPHRRRAPHRG